MDRRAKTDMTTNTLNTYLSQALNIELVNIILSGIIDFNKRPLKKLENGSNENIYESVQMRTLNKI